MQIKHKIVGKEILSNSIYRWVLFTFLFITFKAYTQPNHEIIKFGTKEGLTQFTVNDIAVDDKGMIWVTTEDGIFRFDGKHFQRPTGNLHSSRLRRVSYSKAYGIVFTDAYHNFYRINNGKIEQMTHFKTDSNAILMCNGILDLKKTFSSNPSFYDKYHSYIAENTNTSIKTI
ncbi:MAG: hypothetical protein HYZ42_00740, partial [Bacteroidetes bacterium]|nr:hypothetical protein [Bacteroidota bacterium]